MASAPNWSAGIEYDHLFMGRREQLVPRWRCNPLLAGAANRVSQDVDLLMLQVNYNSVASADQPPVYLINHSIANQSPGIVRGFCFDA